MAQPITKLEAARRQLVTAIRLFFDGQDSVSVYTLAQASWEVLDALCKHHGKKQFLVLSADANKTSVQKVRRIARHGRDFFKHADRDPEAVLVDFTDEDNDHVLISATFDYGELASSKPMEVQVFQVWYFAVYPEKLPRPAGALFEQASKEYFPGIESMARREQKAFGLQQLKRFLNDPDLMRYPGTDASEVAALLA